MWESMSFEQTVKVYPTCHSLLPTRFILGHSETNFPYCEIPYGFDLFFSSAFVLVDSQDGFTISNMLTTLSVFVTDFRSKKRRPLSLPITRECFKTVQISFHFRVSTLFVVYMCHSSVNLCQTLKYTSMWSKQTKGPSLPFTIFPSSNMYIFVKIT